MINEIINNNFNNQKQFNIKPGKYRGIKNTLKWFLEFIQGIIKIYNYYLFNL